MAVVSKREKIVKERKKVVLAGLGNWLNIGRRKMNTRWNYWQLTFTEHLACVGHCAKYVACVNSFSKEFGPSQLLGVAPAWEEYLCLLVGFGSCQIIYANNMIYGKGFGPCSISLKGQRVRLAISCAYVTKPIKNSGHQSFLRSQYLLPVFCYTLSLRSAVCMNLLGEDNRELQAWSSLDSALFFLLILVCIFHCNRLQLWI